MSKPKPRGKAPQLQGRKPKQINPKSLANLDKAPRFVPGQSGNPGGKPKIHQRLTMELAEEFDRVTDLETTLKELRHHKNSGYRQAALSMRMQVAKGSSRHLEMAYERLTQYGMDEISSDSAVSMVLDAINRSAGDLGFRPPAPGSPLTPRWAPVPWTRKQLAAIRRVARFRMIVAGRRSGKTEIVKRLVTRAAFHGSPYGDGRWGFGAPTRAQAKDIYWEDIKKLVPRTMLACAPSETELTIRLVNGGTIKVAGMNEPERVEGSMWDGWVLDEVAKMRASVFDNTIRPAVSDRRGFCFFVGKPIGRGDYYDRYRAALADESGEWSADTWTSEEVLPPEEVASMKRDMDPLTYQQEVLAEFVTFHGRAYYNFEPAANAARLAYNPDATLILCFDFNVSPGAAVVAQEQDLGNGLDGTGVIGEVHIPNNSTTPAVCRKLIADWGAHRGPVVCYGDATGGNRGTAKLEGSDWDLIRDHLRPTFGGQLSFRVPRQAPPERGRVNAMNTRIRTSDGRIRLKVDPAKAPMTAKDLDGVRVLEGGSGEIDKGANRKMTHWSDALGYYVLQEFPIGGARVTIEELRL